MSYEVFTLIAKALLAGSMAAIMWWAATKVPFPLRVFYKMTGSICALYSLSYWWLIKAPQHADEWRRATSWSGIVWWAMWGGIVLCTVTWADRRGKELIAETERIVEAYGPDTTGVQYPPEGSEDRPEQFDTDNTTMVDTHVVGRKDG